MGPRLLEVEVTRGRGGSGAEVSEFLYKYLLFVVTVLLSYLRALLNICIGFLNSELNYRELYP